MALVLKSALLIFNHKNPQLRYALSALAMLASLLLPLITFSIIYRAEIALSSTSTVALTLTELMQELKQPDGLFSYQELSALLPSLLPYIALLWLATVTLLAGKLLVEIYNVNKLPQQHSVEPSAQLSARFNELAKQINLTITPTLLISLKVDVPMAIGWLKPVVLIPASMISGLNSAQLEMLILHELAHIRRHDYLVNFLQTFVEILLFFHPAVLWVSKQMRNEREYCSDDIAVQHCGDAVAYAHTLADTASLCTKAHHNHTIPSMAMAASGGDLKQRVIRLVDHHCAPQNNISKWFASATIIFSVLLLSSKQLLTMPLLDLWHNETPFKANSSSSTNINSDKNIQQATNNKILPTSSIAQQLLTPKTTDNNQTLMAEKTTSRSSKITQAVLPQSTPSQNDKLLAHHSKTSTQSLIDEEDAEFSAQLDNLAASKHKVANKFTDTVQSGNSSMVEQAFEKTDSNNQNAANNNPYAKALAQLANSDSNAKKRSVLPINKQVQEATLVTLDNTQNTKVQTPALLQEKPAKKLQNSQKMDMFTTQQTVLTQRSQATEQKQLLTLAHETTPVRRNAKQLKSVDPIYPSVAKRKGIEIEVKVNFTIDINGQIKDIKFARQNKINYFKNAIRSAIKQWRFLPAKVGDKPVESQMSKVFAFSLQS
ncbi:MAG: TonB family protein [Colwellia sp.]|nr:TonB family protein [Colwellia sp.]MCW9082555.1 TonB family protein [Colwellia sp.]